MTYAKTLLTAATLALLAGGFSAGCANNKGGDACCCSGDKAECKENDCDGKDCKDADCKDKDTNKPSAAAAGASQASAPINKICPIGGHDVDATQTVSYQGKTIAFCCADCKQEFAAKDEAGKAAILATASAK